MQYMYIHHIVSLCGTSHTEKIVKDLFFKYLCFVLKIFLIVQVTKSRKIRLAGCGTYGEEETCVQNFDEKG
jgi:hypothetical protein